MASTLLSACSDSGGAIATSQPTATTTAPASDTASTSPSTLTPPLSPSASSAAEATVAPGDGAADRKLDATAVLTISAVDTITGDVIVGGYVRGVIEANGTCLYSLTNTSSGSAVTVKTTGVDNADTTSCGSTAIPAAKVPSGKYAVVLTYTNATGSTSSSPVDLEVSR